MNKSLTTLVLLALTAILFSMQTQLKDYAEITQALESGKSVKTVIKYGECKLISDNEESDAPSAVGGMNIDVWEYFNKMAFGNKHAFLVFSHSSLINYKGYIYNYCKIKVKDDNSVIITAQYANANDFDIEMDEKFFTNVNDGKNKGSIFFYTND